MNENREPRRLERAVEELVEAAKCLGLKVRRERLLREIGYRARGGLCRLREENLVIIDRDQSPHEQIEILAEALRGRDLDSVYLSPAVRRLIEGGFGEAQ